MWEQVEGFATSIMEGMVDEILPSAPQDRIDASPLKTSESLKHSILDDLDKFFKRVKDKYFRSIWEKSDVNVYKKRAKRYAYRFIVDREKSASDYFWRYPGCMNGWISVDILDDGSYEFDEHSMYPGEGADPPQNMTKWEIFHCPWYLESEKWSIPFGATEKFAFQVIKQGGTPSVVLSEAKVCDADDESVGVERIETILKNVVVAVDRSRKPKSGNVEAKQESKEGTPVPVKSSKYVWTLLLTT